MTQRRPKPAGPPRSPYALFGLGFEIAAPVVLLMYAGYRLDLWLGSEPWLTLLGALLGVVIGFANLFRRVRQQAEGAGEEKE